MDRSAAIAFVILTIFSTLAVGVFLLDNPVENARKKGLDIFIKDLISDLRPQDISDTKNQIVSNERAKSIEYNNFGNDNFKKGENDIAEQYYQKAIEADPSFSYPYINISSIFFGQGLDTDFAYEEHIKAKPYVEKAIELEPEHFAPYQILGRIYQIMARKIDVGSFDGWEQSMPIFAQAEKYLEKSVELKYDELISHRQLVFVYAQQGKIDEALREIEIAESLGIEAEDKRIILIAVENAKSRHGVMDDIRKNKESGAF